MFRKSLVITILLLGSVSIVTGDGSDWVDVDYLIRQQKNPSKDTADARTRLIQAAGTSAKKGPWSIQTPEDQLPPSKNRNDYMSFAPYYWADCNWCASKRGISYDEARPQHLLPSNSPSSRSASATVASQFHHRRMFKHKRYQENVLGLELPGSVAFPIGSPVAVGPDFPLLGPSSSSFSSASTTSSENVVTGTLDPAQARAKTSQSSSCTPSPTTSMAPKATWTSCPYKRKDGQANPDTRMLAGPNGINDMSQAVFYNALSFAITGTRSYSQKAVSFIDTFFLTKATAMTPNINYGQIIRGIGPEHQVGTFTGVLDTRGMVKVVNAIIALKNAKSPDWDDKKDAAMMAWMTQYVQWLETSSIAKKTSSSANNHATYFYGQLAAVKLLLGDIAGARSALSRYFGNQFLDHIAASGEQPFEAVRSRPYHYRCFNLEAMITAAKLGDYLGIDFWTAKTNNGATIQTAVDFTMQVDPGSESVANIIPHVAAAAAAYGDPGSKYAAFLQKHDSSYKSERFWLYDQTSALKMAPATQQKRELNNGPWHRPSARWTKRDQPETTPASSDDVADGVDSQSPGQNNTISGNEITFKCPAVFNEVTEVELDNGLFVTCDQLKQFYVLLYPDQDTKA